MGAPVCLQFGQRRRAVPVARALQKVALGQHDGPRRVAHNDARQADCVVGYQGRGQRREQSPVLRNEQCCIGR
jgi:hypothetical protein